MKKTIPKDDDTYPDARERGDAVLRRLLTTKPKPKWKPPTKPKRKGAKRP
jgi:hypothetical protein